MQAWSEIATGLHDRRSTAARSFRLVPDSRRLEALRGQKFAASETKSRATHTRGMAPTDTRTPPCSNRHALSAVFVMMTLLSGCSGGGEDSSTSDDDTATSDDGMSDTSAASDDTVTDTPPPTGDPGPGAFDPDYETSDAFFTRMSTSVPSQIHAQQRTWYSSNISDLPRTGPFTVPEGTVAIKAEYDQAGDNFITVVMIKREAGYDPDGNDWYYEGREPDGSLASSPTPGPAGLCKGCHSGGADTDFLLGFDLEN